MATIPSSNATATRYAANGKDIWVPSQTINDIAVGGGALPEALRGTYGKIFTTKPTNPHDSDLFYGIDEDSSSASYLHKVLQYYDSGWVNIFDADMTGTVYETDASQTGGVAPTDAQKVAAAQTKLYTENANIGDTVIVHWTEGVDPDEVEKAESYICISKADTPAQASDYAVAHITSEDAKEVKYTGASGHIISTGTTVEECLQALDQASADFGRYALAGASTSGNEELTFANEGVNKNFNGYTGVLKLTCCIDCGNHSSTGYVSTGIVTCTVIAGNIQADSMSLADYYVESYETGLPGDTYMDIFDLDFTIDSTSHNLVVRTPQSALPSDKTIVSGTTVTVKVQW
jgi:hypothetical protein